ncbi:cobalamin biosynthesis protein CobD/CbiB [Nitrospirillum sp. BR 11828]|uniref:cobalamin biosynthesis protein CobD/CbiB n=1 Tax=Nitrospirillum sp. BR 11828 TaxID=3104325 RepID=UPI002ACA5257|nr:cobalamin biosynthesis protein [Nitrospirillum sp. BR 11828]MDZ5646444.1 cobalamin biosynthesis protein [Nitrospirillum sp. BR 11828]
MIPLPFAPPRAESLLLLALALALNAFIAGFPAVDRWLMTPQGQLAQAVRWADKRLNRIERLDSVRLARGALLVLVLTGGVGLAALVLTIAAVHLRVAWLLSLLLVTRALVFGRLLVTMRTLLAAAPAADEDALRQVVAPLTHKPVWSMDRHAVLRAGMEALVGQASRGLVAPLFWFALFDLPGLMMWVTVETVAATVGHTSARYAAFGRPARRALGVMDWVPARLTVLFLAAGCLIVPGSRPALALAALRTHHVQGTAALPLHAVARALNLALAGPRKEGEVVVYEDWLGTGRARVDTSDLRAVVALTSAASLMAVCIALLALVWA